MKKIKIKRSSVVLWVLISLLLIMVVVSVTLRRDDDEPEALTERPTPVQVQWVEHQSVTDRVRLPGRIEPDIRARLAVDKGGRVTAVGADKGDAVEAGQVLLQLDDRSWRALKKQAEVEYRTAQREWQRWQELSEADLVSTGEMDRVQARYERAEAQLEDARVHVEQCVLYSPGDGWINSRLLEVGEYAPEGAAAFEWVVLDPVRVTLDVPERDIRGVQKEDAVVFGVTALGAGQFIGTVQRIAAAAAPGNNTFRVEAQVPNEDHVLRPGMIATVHFERARRADVVVVPLAAVIPRKGEHFVFVAKGDRAIRRLVKIDRILGTEAILADGLEPGEELIIDGHRELLDGEAIERVNADSSS